MNLLNVKDLVNLRLISFLTTNIILIYYTVAYSIAYSYSVIIANTILNLDVQLNYFYEYI